MRRTAGPGRRGAVILEAALVTPLLLLILCGIVEMAFLMKADNAVAALVSEGGRSASSAVAGRAEQSHHASQFCAAPACSVENAPALADVAAAAVERAHASLPKDSIEELWVYKANSEGYPGTAQNSDFDSCVTACVVYRWSPEHRTFDYVSGHWSAGDISSCPDSPDTVGVYIKAKHSFLAGLFSDGVQISDHAVFSLKPVASSTCPPRAG